VPQKESVNKLYQESLNLGYSRISRPKFKKRPSILLANVEGLESLREALLAYAGRFSTNLPAEKMNARMLTAFHSFGIFMAN